jgi:hypothetical protein
MHRKSVVILLIVACCIAAAAGVYFRFDRTLPTVDLQAPVHYFIASDHFDRERLRCNFTIGFDRSRMNDLWALPLQPCSLGNGWREPTQRGVDVSANRADLDFYVDSPHWTHLVLRIRAVRDPKKDRIQKMRVRLNGRRLGTAEIPLTWTTIGIEIPSGALRAGVNNFKLSFSHRAPLPGPHRQKIQPRFAARIQEIELTTAPPPQGLVAKVRRWIARDDLASPRQHPVQVFDQTRDHFVVREPGTLVMPVRLPATAHALELEVAAPAGLDCRESRLVLDVQGLTTGEHRSTTLSTAELCEGNGDRAFIAELPTDRFAGEDCVLSFAVQPEPAGSGHGRVSGPTSCSSPSMPRGRTTFRATATIGQRLPTSTR